MATQAEKTDRRWKVVKAILLFTALWGIAVFIAYMFGYDPTKLDVISGGLFSSAIIGLIGNWLTSPTPDSDKG